MILLTVGGQLPFDRLVEAVDRWALREGRDDVFAQIGESRYEPRAIRVHRFLEPREFNLKVMEAEAIVAHAGVGTIISALQHGKPILVLPRRRRYGEHRSDHQVEMARRFAERGWVLAAMCEAELPALLSRLESFSPEPIASSASSELIERIRAAAVPD